MASMMLVDAVELQLGVAGNAGHGEFVKLQMAEEHVGRILRMIMFRILCCHRCA